MSPELSSIYQRLFLGLVVALGIVAVAAAVLGGVA